MSHGKVLKEYNQWRRGDGGYEMPDPTAIGIAIDSVLAQLAALKEENEAQLLRHEIERDQLKAQVAELEGLVRDIKQYDINEATKRLLEGGRKFNYSLPLNIRERIAAALREPANEG